MRGRDMMAALALLVASGGAVAQTLPDAKLGLWQWTVSAHVGAAMIPPEALAQMTPAVRAQVQARLRHGPAPHVSQSCLTAEKLRRGFTMAERHADTCQQTLISSSRGGLEFRGVCQTGQGPAESHVTLKMLNRETMEGHVEAMPPGGGEVAMTATIAGVWQGADCGSVKP